MSPSEWAGLLERFGALVLLWWVLWKQVGALDRLTGAVHRLEGALHVKHETSTRVQRT